MFRPGAAVCDPPPGRDTRRAAPQVDSEKGDVMAYLLLLLLSFITVTAFAPAGTLADLESEKAELMRLHRAHREAHFKTDADMLMARSPEVLISVSRGKVHRSSREEGRKRFVEYFRGAKYYEWDDMEEPTVRVSDDASMAWMITRLKVRRVQRDAAGVEREERFVYAGLTTYEKRGGKWMRVANASTFEPPN
jgi:hypothetical protein